ncbi:hypothetical protein KM043_003430 [Ampulex compressa]|nr:hypothetical protein KM043_003430 [Ampulex compressa]
MELPEVTSFAHQRRILCISREHRVGRWQVGRSRGVDRRIFFLRARGPAIRTDATWGGLLVKDCVRVEEILSLVRKNLENAVEKYTII